MHLRLLEGYRLQMPRLPSGCQVLCTEKFSCD
uniref:Uncharacterized protein n=1 Tax=Anguilla anguilla TaxID=7936 RepID=A0A0E9U6D7_ANGAN